MMPFQAMRLRAPVAAPTAGFNVTAYALNGDTGSFDQRLGWSFTVGASNILVTKLRVIAVAGNNELVRIHRNSDGVLMASATIASASNVWVEGAVSSVTLLAGVSYTVSSRFGGVARSLRRNNTVTIASAVTKVGDVFGTDDNRPTSSTGNTYQFCDFGS